MTAQMPLDQRPAVELENYPELTTLLTGAVDEALTSSNVTRERNPDLAAEVERAAGAAALGIYERMEVVAVRISTAAAADRRARMHLVATNAWGIAERVADAAAEVHDIEEASAHDLVLVVASAAADLAAGIRFDDELAASVAAATVVKATSEAAAVDVNARATAASGVARAAAVAAADVVAEAASIASAAEAKVATDASDRRQDGLETCYEVAVAAADAVLAGQPGMPLHQPFLRTSRVAQATGLT